MIGFFSVSERVRRPSDLYRTPWAHRPPIRGSFGRSLTRSMSDCKHLNPSIGRPYSIPRSRSQERKAPPSRYFLVITTTCGLNSGSPMAPLPLLLLYVAFAGWFARSLAPSLVRSPASLAARLLACLLARLLAGWLQPAGSLGWLNVGGDVARSLARSPARSVRPSVRPTVGRSVGRMDRPNERTNERPSVHPLEATDRRSAGRCV